MKTFNRVFCEPYQKTGVESVAKGGLALGAKQKINIVKLKVVLPAEIFVEGQIVVIEKNSVILVKEEDLHNGMTGKQIMNLEGLKNPFIVIEPQYMYGIGSK
jgi:hypothetical protein